MADPFPRIASYVDEQSKYFIDKLAEAVQIASVSGDVAHRPAVFAMADWLQKEMTRLGVKYETRMPGESRVLLILFWTHY